MRVLGTTALLACAMMASICAAQQASDGKGAYSRVYEFSAFADYSDTSSHILMGASRQRSLGDIGFGYTRRVLHFHGSDLAYHTEVRPVVFESDPVAITSYYFPPFDGNPSQTETLTGVFANKCTPGTSNFTYTDRTNNQTNTGVVTITCATQWTFAQSFLPLGFKYSMRTGHRLQPYIIGTLGILYGTRPIPLATAGEFNYAFDFGAGVELFRSHQRAVAVEYRYHHFSNHGTAPDNPGVDNMMLNVSYNFGR